MTENLKRGLFEEYGGFADKRIKNLAKSNTFIIDDRTDADEDSRGQLYLWFCMMFLVVEGPRKAQLVLRGSIPSGPAVEEWLSSNGARLEDGQQQRLAFNFDDTQLPSLLELSKAIRAIVRPGNRYSVPSYKYVCPRTASSLERLVSVLNRLWS